jgi:pyrimidine-nucleoside phosphorylase
MIPAELIKKKRNHQPLTESELEVFINGYLNGSIPEYQMSAMLMAIYLNGMDNSEIDALVIIMLNSGQRMNFQHINKYIADKHSTGGVGDKVSIILGPLLAAAGLAIPMISGRSLGHTGGTLDKLETIPGFQTDVDLITFKKLVDNVGIAIIGQTAEICPADRKMYALRDVTGTVESIPLICGSIMSKKISEGIQGLVLDVKTGNGAFMKTLKDAQRLGNKLKQIGKSFYVKTDVVYSSMDQPLGRYAGLWCEIQEAVAGLQGNGPEDTMVLTYELGFRLLKQAQLAESLSDAKNIFDDLIKSGNAYNKFLEMVGAQGGDQAAVENHQLTHKPKFDLIITANKKGIIQAMDTYQTGLATIELGCGRKTTDDIIDPSAGIEFFSKIGDEVQVGDPVMRCFNSNQEKLNSTEMMLNDSFTISEKEAKLDLIL